MFSLPVGQFTPQYLKPTPEEIAKTGSFLWPSSGKVVQPAPTLGGQSFRLRHSAGVASTSMFDAERNG
jgi:hypothetical protein